MSFVGGGFGVLRNRVYGLGFSAFFVAWPEAVSNIYCLFVETEERIGSVRASKRL